MVRSMTAKRKPSPRKHLAGLLASIIAVAAPAVTVLADNHDAGFGHTVTHGEQIFLFVIASMLLVAEAITYLTHRPRRATKHGNRRLHDCCAQRKVRP